MQSHLLSSTSSTAARQRSTSSNRRLKKQLLREAVDDNVSIESQPPTVRRQAGSRPARALKRRRKWWLAALGLTVLVASTMALRLASEIDATAAPLPENLPPAKLDAPAPEPEIDLADLTFPAPRPIDVEVFPLEVRRVVLDPGHGGEDDGTTSDGMTEKHLTLDIASRLGQLLESDGYEVLMTRDGDHTLSLRDRAQFANTARADVFVSIHINWLVTRQVRGIETYYIGPTDDPALKELARRENRESGYSLADLRHLLEGIYADLRQEESRQLASRVQGSLFRSLREVNPELLNRGIKTAPFVVLVATEMPAILAEVSCLSNEKEAELLSRPLYREHIAEALHRGLRGFARDVHQTEEKRELRHER